MPNAHPVEPRDRIARGIIATALLIAIGAAGFARPTASQPAPAASSAPDIVAPRGQRDVKDLTYGEWKKRCFKPGGAKAICRTSITGKMPTGQTAIRVDIIEREGDGAARLQVFCPVGMYLREPARMVIDQGEPHPIPYNWCLANACIAATVAEPKMIKDMTAGQTLRLQFVDSSLLTLTTTLPLVSFATAHGGAPTETFEQDIDE